MRKSLKIPKNRRHQFSQPLGKLISGSRDKTISEVVGLLKKFKTEKNEINCFLVGDIVTKDFLEHSFLREMVKISVIDEKTKRNHIELDIESFFQEIIEMENEESGINPESFNIFKRVIHSNQKTLVKITRGEEDLLVLPLVLSLPIKKNVLNFVFYGQPPITDSEKPIPEGIVMVKVNKATQKIVKQFIALMTR